MLLSTKASSSNHACSEDLTRYLGIRSTNARCRLQAELAKSLFRRRFCFASLRVFDRPSQHLARRTRDGTRHGGMSSGDEWPSAVAALSRVVICLTCLASQALLGGALLQGREIQHGRSLSQRLLTNSGSCQQVLGRSSSGCLQTRGTELAAWRRPAIGGPVCGSSRAISSGGRLLTAVTGGQALQLGWIDVLVVGNRHLYRGDGG